MKEIIMTIFRTNACHRSLVGFLFALTCFVIVNRAVAVRNAENADVRDLLSQAAHEASALDYDADQMEALLRTDASWETHAAMLDSVKEHVNELGRTIAKLQAERGQASVWQQQAIDRVLPLLQELAANTTAAIKHLNQNQIRPVSGNYPEYLEENAQTAHELARIITATVEYGHTKAKLDKIQQTLGVASK
jgi:hypothetical protein